MVDIQKEVDEVWLALDQAATAFKRNGHTPSVSQLDCYDCYALQLIERAKLIYIRSRQVKTRRIL